MSADGVALAAGYPAIGITMFPTDRTMAPARIAAEAEDRGFESVFFPEHSHIPAHRRTPWPGATPGDEDLPDYYWHINDQIVSLAMAAAVTEHIRLGTAVTLVPQHDPIWLAKQVATLDHLSDGRVVLGVGFAWNREQCDAHGVPFARRRELTRDHVGIMRALWTQDEASYSGELAGLAPSLAYPKPAQPGGPPVVLGGGWGPRLLDHLCQWADGWMPISARPSLGSRLDLLRAACDERGRDPATLSVTVMGAVETREGLAQLASEGVDRAVLTIWDEAPDAVLRTLDRFAALV
jgi:probable F420-dependent oxidoreductase